MKCGLAPVPIIYKGEGLRGRKHTGEGCEVDFDIMAELGSTDRQGFDASMAELAKSGVGARIVADEENFLNRVRTKSCVIEERVTREPS